MDRVQFLCCYWANLGLSSSAQAFFRDAVALNCRVLSLCCHLRSWPVVRPDVCLQLTAGAAVVLVCVVIFSFFQGKGNLGVMLTLVRAVWTLSGLCHCFGWALTKGILEGAGLQKNVRWIMGEKLIPRLRWREHFYCRMLGWSVLLINLVESIVPSWLLKVSVCLV